MKIAIHQPNFIPWQGYFDKIADCDLFVLLDDVQFSKGGLTNRTTFTSGNNTFGTVIPVEKTHETRINKVKLKNWKKTQGKLIRTLEQNYKHAYPTIRHILKQDWQYLADLNIELIKQIKLFKGILTPMIKSSDYDFVGKKSDLILDIVQTLGGTEYLTGAVTHKYLDQEKFEDAGIKIVRKDFTVGIDNYNSIIDVIEKTWKEKQY